MILLLFHLQPLYFVCKTGQCTDSIKEWIVPKYRDYVSEKSGMAIAFINGRLEVAKVLRNIFPTLEMDPFYTFACESEKCIEWASRKHLFNRTVISQQM